MESNFFLRGVFLKSKRVSCSWMCSTNSLMLIAVLVSFLMAELIAFLTSSPMRSQRPDK